MSTSRDLFPTDIDTGHGFGLSGEDTSSNLVSSSSFTVTNTDTAMESPGPSLLSPQMFSSSNPYSNSAALSPANSVTDQADTDTDTGSNSDSNSDLDLISDSDSDSDYQYDHPRQLQLLDVINRLAVENFNYDLMRETARAERERLLHEERMAMLHQMSLQVQNGMPWDEALFKRFMQAVHKSSLYGRRNVVSGAELNTVSEA